MSWITIAWSMIAGTCLTLAALHLLIWLRGRDQWVSLAFSLWAVAVAVAAIFELALMYSDTTKQYGELLRWMHIPFALTTVGYLWFVRAYLQAGRVWLLLLIFGVSVAQLAVNFAFEPNVNYREITALHDVPLWGEMVAVPVGVPSPWSWLGRSIALLILLFLGDAAVASWRQGRRRETLGMGVAFLGSSLASIVLLAVTMERTSAMPLTVSWPSMIAILTFAYILSRDLFEAGRTAEELKQSQDRMRLAASSADLGLWEWDIARDEIWTNEISRARYGIGQSEPMDLDRLLQSLHPDDRDVLRHAIDSAFEGEGDFQVEYRAFAPDGTTRWIAAHGQVERGAHGKPLRIRGVSMDVTERKQVQLALEQSEQRYRALFERSKNGIIFADAGTRKFKYANPAAARMLNCTQAELCCLGVEDICPPEVLDDVYRRFEAQQRGEQVDVDELPIIRKDGSVFYVELSSSAFATSEGQFTIAFFTDVTQRKKAEDSLRNSERLARMLLNATTDVTQLLDEEGTILDLNDAMAAILGGTREELIGTCVFDRFSSKAAESRRQRVRQALAEGKPIRFVDRDRPGMAYDTGVYPIATPEGERDQVVIFAHDITAMEEAVQALQASEEKFRSLMDQAPDPIVIWNPDGTVAEYNQAWVDLWGISGEALPMVLRQYNVLSDRQFIRHGLLPALKKAFIGEPVVFPAVFYDSSKSAEGIGIDPSGFAKAWIQLSFYPVKDERRAVKYIVGLQKDITAQKESEIALRKSEARFRATFEQAAVGIAHVAPDGRFLRINQKYCEIVGYTHEEMLQRTFQDITHPDDLDNDVEQSQRLLRGEIATYTMEKRYFHKSGRIVWVSLTVSLVFDEARQPNWFVSVVQDVTARKEAERLLQESEAKLREAQKMAKLGSWEWNIKTDRIIWTDEVYHMYGIEPDTELTYQRLMEAIHPADREYHDRTTAYWLENKGGDPFEYRVVCPDGSVKHIFGSGRVECDATGEPVRMVGTLQDVTKSRQAEAELQRHRTELAHFSRVSTMGQLASALAHELNQPLGAILSNAEAAEILLEADAPALDEVREILADIRRDDERAAEVIRRMRALLLRRDMELEPVDINELVQRVLQLVQSEASTRQVSIRLELAPAPPPIYGDRIHLEQVLLNLIMNGMDATAANPLGERLVTVGTCYNADGDLEVRVSDNGPGIAPDRLPKLFEPFFTTKPDGMGMGIAIARRIVQAHNGHIFAENNPGEGAAFRFTIPVDEGEE